MYNINELKTGTPISCTTPNCQPAVSVPSLQIQVDSTGLEFAICRDTLFLVLNCPNPGCIGKLVVKSTINEPLLDMRGQLLVPEPNTLQNGYVQRWILKNIEKWHDHLKFQIIPDWDDSCLSTQDFLNSFNPDSSAHNFLMVPFCMSEECFRAQTPSIFLNLKRLARLVPGTPKWRNLLICMAPFKKREVVVPGAVFADGFAPSDLTERREAWKSILEEAAGSTFEDAILKKLKTIDIKLPKIEEIDTLIERELFYKAFPLKTQLWECIYDTDFAKQSDTLLNTIFKSIYYSVCTEFALADKRKELLAWPEKVEKGKALFIDAPMGLGKTYSIVEALASNPNLSAVIFMPTKRMCEEIIENLKSRIIFHRKIDTWNIVADRDQIKDENGDPIFDTDGTFLYRYKREFLENEVYYADGINPRECPYYNEFVDRYRYGLFKKKDICTGCNKYLKKETKAKVVNCRFRRHHLDAPLSRIVVTTHHQYKNFIKQSSIKKWYKNGLYKKNANGRIIKDSAGKKIREEGFDRDFYIIDEDIIISQGYTPTSLNKKELTDFIETISDFLYDSNKISSETISKIEIVSSKYTSCKKTGLVPPIDPEFKLPYKVKKEWNDAFYKQNFTIPEILDWQGPVGNHLDIIEKAISKGFVIENYRTSIYENGEAIQRSIKKSCFSNPTTFDLSNLPPHVFFDGTMLKEKFLSEKLLNVSFKNVKIKIDPIWDVRVWQNIWSDLPKYLVKNERKNVEQFISDLFSYTDKGLKYFIVTKKDIEEEYLSEFIKSYFPDIDCVINHFGNLRGENRAKDCNVGEMIGSYGLSDAVEIAMAIDFIQDKISMRRKIPTKNNLWSFSDINKRRIYFKDFGIIGELASSVRYSEHRQALARTRYLFHDVDFFIISKDPVQIYEPYFQVIETENYRNDLWSKKTRSDSDYPETEKTVLEWLIANDQVRRKDIENVRGVRAGTVGKHLKKMVEKGILYKPNPTGHFYKLSSDYIINNGELIRKN